MFDIRIHVRPTPRPSSMHFEICIQASMSLKPQTALHRMREISCLKSMDGFKLTRRGSQPRSKDKGIRMPMDALSVDIGVYKQCLSSTMIQFNLEE
jgi:hypothetical protein